MKQADPDAEIAKKYDMNKFKYLFVAGRFQGFDVFFPELINLLFFSDN